MVHKILYRLFVTILISSIGFGFTAFKSMQHAAATNYVHSTTCYIDHYLELDCFDGCNGTQVNAASQHKHNTPLEKIIVTAFDAVTVVPLRVKCTAFIVVHCLIANSATYPDPFLNSAGKPPQTV